MCHLTTLHCDCLSLSLSFLVIHQPRQRERRNWKTKCLWEIKKKCDGKFVANGKSFTVVVFPSFLFRTHISLWLMFTMVVRKRRKIKKEPTKMCSLNWSKREIYCHNFCVSVSLNEHCAFGIIVRTRVNIICSTFRPTLPISKVKATENPLNGSLNLVLYFILFLFQLVFFRILFMCGHCVVRSTKAKHWNCSAYNLFCMYIVYE